MHRLAVLTSGGDSPGVNACVRAVVRMALHYGWEVWGVLRGYAGLLGDDFTSLTSRSVSHVIERGGTFLGSSRCEEFSTAQGLREAQRSLNERDMDALVVIGGDGSMRGAHALSETGIPVVGIPATIENDVYGTDQAVGVDTALNTAIDAIDRIKDTASSHEQAFLIEMAGRQCGYMALMAGIAGGAEIICLPEVPFTLDGVARQVANSYVRGKRHCIIAVATGAKPQATEIVAHLENRRQETGFQVRLSMLGHIQRGGSPSARDRFLATCLGAGAVEQLHAGKSGLLVGMVQGEVTMTPLSEVAQGTRGIDESDYAMAQALAR
ncbi:MAG: 6-phosphofructokinase [Anaerolineae bacterium]|nr:6-phosphofructokinase [Anaerolineae bacterium]